MFILVEKSWIDSKSSSSDGSGSSSPEEPYQIYEEKVDISRLPRIYHKCYVDGDVLEEGEEEGVYMFPGTDKELLNMCHRPRPMNYWLVNADNDVLRPLSYFIFQCKLVWDYLLTNLLYLWDFSDFSPSEIYHVDVKADRCTVEECLELLKRIGCDNRFIINSVESARLFYAELNKDEAVKLKGLKEIRSVYARSELLFDM